MVKSYPFPHRHFKCSPFFQQTMKSNTVNIISDDMNNPNPFSGGKINTLRAINPINNNKDGPKPVEISSDVWNKET